MSPEKSAELSGSATDGRRRRSLRFGIAIARGGIGAVGGSKGDGRNHGKAEDDGDGDNFGTHAFTPFGDRLPDRAQINR